LAGRDRGGGIAAGGARRVCGYGARRECGGRGDCDEAMMGVVEPMIERIGGGFVRDRVRREGEQ